MILIFLLSTPFVYSHVCSHAGRDPDNQCQRLTTETASKLVTSSTLGWHRRGVMASYIGLDCPDAVALKITRSPDSPIAQELDRQSTFEALSSI